MKTIRIGAGSLEDLAKMLAGEEEDRYSDPMPLNEKAAKVQQRHMRISRTLTRIAKAIAWVVNVFALGPLSWIHKQAHKQWVKQMSVAQPELQGHSFRIDGDDMRYRLKLDPATMTMPHTKIRHPEWADALARQLDDTADEPSRPSVH